jgi:mono/diheme cytochrome c family protein
MPRLLIYAFLIVVALSFVPMAFLAKERVTSSEDSRLQIVPDMDAQPKFKAQATNSLFADDRAMRPPVPGTVARDELDTDGHLYRGQVGGEWASRLPVPVSESLLKRGQERYNIFCATCHGLTGLGDGMVARRADQLQEGTWTPPTDLSSSVVVERPDGHIFNTISHGIRNMPAYGTQIDVTDRWAIVAYVRALQKSRNATLADVPEDVRPSLQ